MNLTTIAARSFNTNKAFFEETVKKLGTPEGKAKIAKVQKLGELAKRLGHNQAAVALAWTLLNPHVSTILLGATKPDQLQANIEALEVLPKLTPEVAKEIEDIFQNKPEPVPSYGRARHYTSA